jgi:hypothetical protein
MLNFLHSTRPFLSTIEKKWIAFQLLTGMRDARSRKVRYCILLTTQVYLKHKHRLHTEISSHKTFSLHLGIGFTSPISPPSNLFTFQKTILPTFHFSSIRPVGGLATLPRNVSMQLVVRLARGKPNLTLIRETEKSRRLWTCSALAASLRSYSWKEEIRSHYLICSSIGQAN